MAVMDGCKKLIVMDGSHGWMAFVIQFFCHQFSAGMVDRMDGVPIFFSE